MSYYVNSGSLDAAQIMFLRDGGYISSYFIAMSKHPSDILCRSACLHPIFWMVRSINLHVIKNVSESILNFLRKSESHSNNFHQCFSLIWVGSRNSFLIRKVISSVLIWSYIFVAYSATHWGFHRSSKSQTSSSLRIVFHQSFLLFFTSSRASFSSSMSSS